MPKTLPILACGFMVVLMLTACDYRNQRTESNLVNHKTKNVAIIEKNTVNLRNQQGENQDFNSKIHEPEKLFAKNSDPKKAQQLKNSAGNSSNNNDIKTVAHPDRIPVLVNKQNMLPESYTPEDLIITNIPFIISEGSERTKMRKEAAVAIEKLFAAANKSGVPLVGISAYRSHLTQAELFNYYAARDGYNKASTYSALPGTSEHETGLSIDVTGKDGQCPAEDCFGITNEAKWLKGHAADYGFIIRYPEGKESITGYQYEPWHLRYVGKKMAKEIMRGGLTLEEYYGVVPVNQ
jgi:D-alanyl-D-alanine carboxypeptidase